MKIYIPRFIDYDYPSDSLTFDAYFSPEKATQRMREELKKAKCRDVSYPFMNNKKEYNYTVEELEIIDSE